MLAATSDGSSMGAHPLAGRPLLHIIDLGQPRPTRQAGGQVARPSDATMVVFSNRRGLLPPPGYRQKRAPGRGQGRVLAPRLSAKRHFAMSWPRLDSDVLAASAHA